jgi:hypothetical protein
MPKLFKCRYPYFRFPNPTYNPLEKDSTKESWRQYKWVYATKEELAIIVEYAQAVKDGKTKGKEFKQLERPYLQLVENKKLDGVKAISYELCHGNPKRVYVRSNLNDKEEILERAWKAQPNTKKRKFLPFGLYCATCGFLLRDKQYKALAVEERKIKPSRAGFDSIVQGYDNEGYFQKGFYHYADLKD